ncbi:MAG TPA: WYL domain-containing protein [Nakamurella sp.]
MATAKAERLLNLVIALVNSPRYRTAAWIRDKVAGYADAPTDEAFFRTFERDKQELRQLGIPLQTPSTGEDGYRIPPVEFALPQLSFTPAEAAALALAGRLWETTALDRAGSGALRKIRDAAGNGGTSGPGGSTTVTSPAGAVNPSTGVAADRPANAERQDSAEPSAAATLLQPRVRTGDPAFAPLYAAVRAKRAVLFDYRKDPTGPAEPRSVQPWGLVSFRGRWYLVGHDDHRGEQRTFRLSRIDGQVRTVGRPGTVRPPAGIDLLAEVANTVERPSDRTATVRMRFGRGAGLRRTATGSVEDRDAPGWDRVTIPLGGLWDTARRIAEQGPDAVVEEPADLVTAVVRLLTGTRQALAGTTGRVPQQRGEHALDAEPRLAPSPGADRSAEPDPAGPGWPS